MFMVLEASNYDCGLPEGTFLVQDGRMWWLYLSALSLLYPEGDNWPQGRLGVDCSRQHVTGINVSKPLLLGTPEHKPGYALVRLPRSRIMHKSDPRWARIPTFHGKNSPARILSHGGDAHGMDLSWGRAEIQNCPATTPKGASTREI